MSSQPILLCECDVVLVTMGISMLTASLGPAYVTSPSLCQIPAQRTLQAIQGLRAIVKWLVMSAVVVRRTCLLQWMLSALLVSGHCV